MRSARRKFLGETIKTAAGIAGLITLAGCGEGEINATTGHTPSPVKPTTVPDNPPSSAVLSRADLPKNVLVILTDQERYPAHWPDGWVEKNSTLYAETNAVRIDVYQCLYRCGTVWPITCRNAHGTIFCCQRGVGHSRST